MDRTVWPAMVSQAAPPDSAYYGIVAMIALALALGIYALYRLFDWLWNRR